MPSPPTYEELYGGSVPQGPLLVVCGEKLNPDEKEAIAVRVAADAGSTRVIVAENLCGAPEAVVSPLADRSPSALIVAACSSSSANAAIYGAVRSGMDAARVGISSLSSALLIDEDVERARFLAAICLAAARRAAVLEDEPLAGQERWQVRGSFDRRNFLAAWHPSPRRSAVIDGGKCLGPANCGICIAKCPTIALQSTKGQIQIDSIRCVSCGACVAPCPTEAISVPSFSLNGLAIELETLLSEDIGNIVLSCERSQPETAGAQAGPHGGPAAIITLPCLAMASPGLILALLVRSSGVAFSSCGRCSIPGPFQKSVSFVERLLIRLGREDLLGRFRVANSATTSKSWDRARETKAEGLKAWGNPKGHIDNLLLKEPMATNAAIGLLVGGMDFADPATETMVDEEAPGGVVRIDDKSCTFCMACTLRCPTGAITRAQDADRLAIEAALCNGCRLCVEVCPENAIGVTRGIDLANLNAGPLVIEPRTAPTCSQCGSQYDDGAIAERVRNILAGTGAPRALVASLGRCPNCRDGGVDSKSSPW